MRVMCVGKDGRFKQTIQLPHIPRVGDFVAVRAVDGEWEDLPVHSVKWVPHNPSRRSAELGEWDVTLVLGT